MCLKKFEGKIDFLYSVKKQKNAKKYLNYSANEKCFT